MLTFTVTPRLAQKVRILGVETGTVIFKHESR